MCCNELTFHFFFLNLAFCRDPLFPNSARCALLKPNSSALLQLLTGGPARAARGCRQSIPVRGVPVEPESIPGRSWVPIPPPQHPLRTLPKRQEQPLKQTNPIQGQLLVPRPHGSSRGCDALPRVARPAEAAVGALLGFPNRRCAGGN